MGIDHARVSLTVPVSAVKLVKEQNYTDAEAAKSLSVNANSIRNWLKKFGSEVGSNGNADAALGAALRRLRQENKRLRMEREI